MIYIQKNLVILLQNPSYPLRCHPPHPMHFRWCFIFSKAPTLFAEIFNFCRVWAMHAMTTVALYKLRYNPDEPPRPQGRVPKSRRDVRAGWDREDLWFSDQKVPDKCWVHMNGGFKSNITKINHMAQAPPNGPLTEGFPSSSHFFWFQMLNC